VRIENRRSALPELELGRIDVGEVVGVREHVDALVAALRAGRVRAPDRLAVEVLPVQQIGIFAAVRARAATSGERQLPERARRARNALARLVVPFWPLAHRPAV
jgi:MoxR-like ATPase